MEKELVFTSTKQVHATPMTRADYVALRKWKLPKDENGADDGMLLTDVSNPKEITWVELDQFNQYYSTSLDAQKPNDAVALRTQVLQAFSACSHPFNADKLETVYQWVLNGTSSASLD